jgi:hypothetical protein
VLVIPRSELPAAGERRLGMTIDLLDGREMTLDARVPSRCP